MSFEHELKIITRAVEEIIPLDELKAKLSLSAKEASLRIKYGIDPTGYDVISGIWYPFARCVIFRFGSKPSVIIGILLPRSVIPPDG
jgi:tyrosyl-tRNA synthetase